MINFKKLEEVAFALMPAHRGDMRSFHVAGIYKKSKLISLGFNKDTTHPKTKQFKYHHLAKVHAELSAVIKGGREDYQGHSIAIIRINRNNQVDFSCPCNGCSDLIKRLGFDKVYHTLENGDWAEVDIYSKKIIDKPNRFECAKVRSSDRYLFS
jgi:deoxycytidylate deaminase